MTQPTRKVKAEFFEVFGHPAPIRIGETLRVRDDPLAIADLAPAVGLEPSRLFVLRRIGGVSSRRAGTSVVCSFVNPGVIQLLARANEILRATQTILDDLGALGFGSENPSPDPTPGKLSSRREAGRELEW